LRFVDRREAAGLPDLALTRPSATREELLGLQRCVVAPRIVQRLVTAPVGN
jgi:hypothetical protein